MCRSNKFRTAYLHLAILPVLGLLNLQRMWVECPGQGLAVHSWHLWLLLGWTIRTNGSRSGVSTPPVACVDSFAISLRSGCWSTRSLDTSPLRFWRGRLQTCDLFETHSLHPIVASHTTSLSLSCRHFSNSKNSRHSLHTFLQADFGRLNSY